MTVTITRRQLLEHHHKLLDEVARQAADFLRQDTMRNLRVAVVNEYRLIFPDSESFLAAALSASMLTLGTVAVAHDDRRSTALIIQTLKAAALVRAAMEDAA